MFWNPHYSSRNLESHQRLEFGIQVPPTKNPEYTVWNPEFKTVLDSLAWRKCRQTRNHEDVIEGLVAFLWKNGALDSCYHKSFDSVARKETNDPK